MLSSIPVNIEKIYLKFSAQNLQCSVQEDQSMKEVFNVKSTFLQMIIIVTNIVLTFVIFVETTVSWWQVVFGYYLLIDLFICWVFFLFN